MNILAIDFGTKYMGLAWMQEGLDVVLPFGLIAVKKSGSDILVPDKLVTLVKEEGIHQIVMGLPVTLEDGSENKNTARVKLFANKLQAAVQVPIIFVDERLSSFEADEMGGDVSRDEKAAMVILEEFKAGNILEKKDI